jgi:hypothetical protein
MTRSRFIGRRLAACTPLGDGGVFVTNLPTSVSIVNDANVPSVTLVNSSLADSPTESPIRATFVPSVSRVITRMVNPGDGSPWSRRKSHAFIRVVRPFDPVSTMSLNQMPSYCRYWLAAASVIDAAATVPNPYLVARSSASRIRVQRWLGLREVPSPGTSSRGANTPPAVRGPFDAENSVETTEPFGQRRTTPAVAAIAWSVRKSSTSVTAPVATGRVAAPPYT